MGSQPESNKDIDLLELFNHYVSCNHHRIALSSRGDTLSYGELDASSSGLAALLGSKGVRVADSVVVLATRSFDLVVFFLAVLKAGAHYIPIDVESFSDTRIQTTISIIQPAIILSSNRRYFASFEVLSWSEVGKDIQLINPLELPYLPVKTQPTDLAYIVFTSGTTSAPKGVMIPRQALSNYVQQGGEKTPFNLNMNNSDIVLLAFSPAFDACTGVIFSTICNGGRLEIAGPEDLEASLQVCTILPATPSMLQSIHTPEKFRSLRTIFLGGEAPSPALIDAWHGGSRKIFNCYGPSETTCASLIAEIPRGKPIVLGFPMSDSEVYLCNADSSPSEEGEICISGPGLAVGYFKDDALTEQRFFHHCGRRFFRTGDFARQEAGGLKFLGRKDALVKNRGYLVNLEVEVVQVLLAQEGVKSATAIQHEGKIVGFITPEWIDSGQIRTTLALQHDVFAVPDQLFALAQLPVTPNGKVDIRELRKSIPKRKCPQNIRRRSLSREPSALRLAIAKNIGILPEDIKDENTFWELGGNSLSAIGVLSDLRFQNLSIPVAKLLGQNSIYCLEANLDSCVTENDIPYKSTEKNPLTRVQERLISGSFTTNCLNYMILKTEIEHKERPGIQDVLKASWHQVLQRHSIFYMVYSLTHDTQSALPCLGELDWQTVTRSCTDWEEEVKKQTQELIQLMDLADPENPPTVFRFVTVPHDRSILLWLVHHARIDGWSASVVVQELQASLDGDILPDAPQFTHASVIQRALMDRESIRACAFWGGITKAAEEAPRLPFDVTAAVPRWENRTQSRKIGEIMKQKDLEDACRKAGISVSTAIHGAWALTLMKYTDSECAAFGTVFSGRNLPMKRADQVVGPLMNSLPFTTRASNTDDKTTWLRSIQDRLAEMSDLQWWSSASSTHGKNAMSPFDTLVVLQYGLPAMPQTCNTIPGPWRFDQVQMTQSLWTLMAESNGEYLNFRLVYDDLVVTSAKTERALHHFKNVLYALLRPQILTVQGVKQCLVDRSELITLVHHSPELHTPYDGPSSLKAAFEMMVDQHPHATAVESNFGTLTYQELDEAANHYASVLLQEAVVGKTVAILSDGSLEWLLAILSVVKTGATYCPIDINLPSRRADLMIKLSRACVLIVPRSQREYQIEPTLLCKKRVLEFNPRALVGTKTRPSDCATLHDSVYLVFTSGTTGTPKGICANNLGVLSYISHGPARLHACPGRKIAQAFSVGFDASAAEIFGSLCYGATLLLKDANNPLANLRKANATMLTPSFLSSLQPADFPNLDTITVGGEALPQGLVDSWCTQRQIYNGYGPSECTIACMFTLCMPNKPVTLGRPIPRMSAYVLDKDGDAVPIGFPGEIHLTGLQVLDGYEINDTGVTGFLPDPFSKGYTMFKTGDIGRWTENMELEFLGRRDRQVKVRGFRVNLDEIETVIQQSSSSIRRNAVIYANNALTAFVVPRNVDEKRIMQALNSTLPPFSRPSRIIQLDQLPQTTNQKTDYQALACMKISTVFEHLTSPSTPIQRAVAQIWSEVLGVDSPDIFLESNFLDIGGHSLSQIKLSRELSRRFQCQISLQTVLQNPVLITLAEAVSLESRKDLQTDIQFSSFLSSAVADNGDETVVSGAETQMVLLSNQSRLPSAFNVSFLLSIDGHINTENFISATDSVLSESRLLRTRYKIVGDNVSRILANSAFSLQVQTTTGIDMSEIQHEVNKPFDLFNDPLLRLNVIQTGKNSHTLLLVAHHCITDATSLRLILDRIKHAYLTKKIGSSNLPSGTYSVKGSNSTRDYLDWTRWKKTLASNPARKSFWSQYLMNRSSILAPLSSAPMLANDSTVRKSFLSPFLATTVEKYCTATHCSMQHMMLSCAAMAANSVYGTNDLLLAIPFSDRSEPGTESILGLFLDVLPVRMRLDEKNMASVQSLLAAAKAASEVAVANRMPSHAIQEITGREPPLFDIMVSFHPRSEALRFELPDCTTKIQRLTPLGTKFPLMMEVFQEEEGCTVEIRSNIALVTDEYVGRLLEAFCATLSRFIPREHSDIITPDHYNY